MAGDAFAGGGIVKLSSDLLGRFADQNVAGMASDMASESWIKSLNRLAEGTPGGAPPGVTQSGEYYQVLPGNTQKGKLTEANELQIGVKGLATTVNDHVTSLHKNLRQLQTDLGMVGSIVTNADDKAAITVDEMTSTLGNLQTGGGTGTGATPTPS